MKINSHWTATDLFNQGLALRTFPFSTESDDTCLCRCSQWGRSSWASIPVQAAASVWAGNIERCSPDTRFGRAAQRPSSRWPRPSPGWSRPRSGRGRWSTVAGRACRGLLPHSSPHPTVGKWLKEIVGGKMFQKHLVMSSQLLQWFSVPILHHDVHSIILKVILKLPSVKEHLWNVLRSIGSNKDVKRFGFDTKMCFKRTND